MAAQERKLTDIVREGVLETDGAIPPSTKEADQVNTGKAKENPIFSFIRGHKLIIGGVGTAAAGTAFGVHHALAVHQEVDPAFVDHLNSSPILVDLPPQSEQPKPANPVDVFKAGRKAAIAQNERDGYYEMTPPPNRKPENLSNIPSTTTIQDIQHIPEIDRRIKNTDLKWGFSGFLEPQQVLTGKDQASLHIQSVPPSASINGYLIAKEKQPDGSIMFAVELPYLDSPKDILTRDQESSTPQLIKKEWRSANLPPSQNIQIGGDIVWIKTLEGKNPTYGPFNSDISWGGPDALPTNKSGSGDRPLAEYAQVGDVVQARIPLDPNLQIDPARLDKLLEGYVELHGGSIDAAKQKLTTIIEDNLHNAQQLLTDANTNTRIPLKNQLINKRHVFTAGSVLFLSQ